MTHSGRGDRSPSAAERKTVVVSGAPGAGKSSLAVPLASALGFPLVAKDYIKETIWDVFDPPVGDVSWSRRTGGVAMEVLWAVASRCPQVVIEANFRPNSAYERDRLRSLGGTVVEVYCLCPPRLAAERYADRAASAGHHAAHVGRVVTDESLAEFDRPMRIGPVIVVDTAAPVDAVAVARQVANLLGQRGEPHVD